MARQSDGHLLLGGRADYTRPGCSRPPDPVLPEAGHNLPGGGAGAVQERGGLGGNAGKNGMGTEKKEKRGERKEKYKEIQTMTGELNVVDPRRRGDLLDFMIWSAMAVAIEMRREKAYALQK